MATLEKNGGLENNGGGIFPNFLRSTNSIKKEEGYKKALQEQIVDTQKKVNDLKGKQELTQTEKGTLNFYEELQNFLNKKKGGKSRKSKTRRSGKKSRKSVRRR